MKRGKRVFSRPLLQEVPHRIVEAEGALIEIEGKQERQALQSPQKIFRVDFIELACLAPKT